MAVGGVEDFVLESPVGNEHQSVIVVEAEGIAVVVQFVGGRRPGNGAFVFVKERHGGEDVALDAAPDRLVALVEEGDFGRSLGGVLPGGEAAVHDVIGAGHDAVVFVALDVGKAEAVAAFVHIGAERCGAVSVLHVSPAGVVEGGGDGRVVGEALHDFIETGGPGVEAGGAELAEQGAAQSGAAADFAVHKRRRVGNAEDAAELAAFSVFAQDLAEVLIEFAFVETAVFPLPGADFRFGVLAGDDVDDDLALLVAVESEAPSRVAQAVHGIAGERLHELKTGREFLSPKLVVLVLRIVFLVEVGDVDVVPVFVDHVVDVAEVVGVGALVDEVDLVGLRSLLRLDGDGQGVGAVN